MRGSTSAATYVLNLLCAYFPAGPPVVVLPTPLLYRITRRTSSLSTFPHWIEHHLSLGWLQRCNAASCLLPNAARTKDQVERGRKEEAKMNEHVAKTGPILYATNIPTGFVDSEKPSPGTESNNAAPAPSIVHGRMPLCHSVLRWLFAHPLLWEAECRYDSRR